MKINGLKAQPAADAVTVADDARTFLYERLAGRISSLIECGTLRPGDRVPSVRQLRQNQQVSVATVLQAYRILENRGFIEARPQSGYYVRPRRLAAGEPALSRPAAGSTRVATGSLVLRFLRTAHDTSLTSLGAALPPDDLLPTRQLHRAAGAVARRAPALANAYDVAPGNQALRQQIARRALDSGCALAADDIVVTNGCQEALQLALRATTRPGDTVAIESPTYFGMLQIIESLGLKACEIPTYPRHGICLDELDRRIRGCRIKACLFMLNYNNPLGSCMPDEKKQTLVQMLTERRVPLIEDDVYGELPLCGPRPKTAKAFDRAGWVLTCSSFCKTLAPGYRIGWVVPGQFLERVTQLKYVSSLGTATLPQLAVADFLAAGGFDHYLRRMRRHHAEQIERVSDAVRRYFPEGTKVSRPSGGYVLWVEWPGSADAVEVFERALEAGICVAPGPIFSPRPAFNNCIRISCGSPWNERFDRALLTLGQIVAAG